MPDERPSFTRGLFAGEIISDLVFPYPPPLDESNREEAATVRRLIAALDDRLGGLIDSVTFDETETIGDDVIAALAKHGFLGMTIPRKYGGLELSPTAYARVFEAVGATDASLGVFIGVHCGLGAKAIVLYGTDAQKQQWLPRIARGEILVAYALTEPEIGSDAQHVKSTAVLSADRSYWTLNGAKIWIGNGHRASVIATFAQTEVERRGEKVMRPTAFLIEPTMQGFRVVETVHKLGIRGSTQAQLEYHNLQVPAANVLGDIGKGFLVAVNVLNAGRLSLTAGCIGGTKRVFREMTAYTKQRVQFDQPLATFEITQRKLARVATDIYAADAMLGVLTHLATRDEADWSLEAAIGKVYASEMVWRTTDEMVQLAGGRGYVKPYPYERYLRDSRINRIFEGANEILRLFIALNGLRTLSAQLTELNTALREPLKHLGLLSEFAATRVRGAFGATASLDIELDERLRNHGEFLEKHVAELRGASEQAIRTHRHAIVDRQLVVERLANMAIELFATACVLSRTQRIIETGHANDVADAIALCNVACVEAGKRFRAARAELASATDTALDTTRRDVAESAVKSGGYAIADAILAPAPRGKPAG